MFRAYRDAPICPQQADAVFFGAFTIARRALCENVIRRVSRDHNVACFHGIFGKDLEMRICNAKVVFLDHAYPGASLEVHRIFPLLAMGKAVVAVRSSDPKLDSEYEGAVRFANTAADIPDLVNKLLDDDDDRNELIRRGLEFVRVYRERSNSHLCLALWDLNERVGRVLL